MTVEETYPSLLIQVREYRCPRHDLQRTDTVVLTLASAFIGVRFISNHTQRNIPPVVHAFEIVTDVEYGGVSELR